MIGPRSGWGALRHAAPVVALLATTLVLYSWGISYGLPAGHRAWDHDDHRLRDYIGFGLAGALAIGTKDQAYGLYVLSPLPIVLSLAAHERRAGRHLGLLRICLDRRILACGAAVVLLFLAGHQVFTNPRLLAGHVAKITGPYSADYRMFDKSLHGHLQSLALSGRNILFSLGWPVVAAGLAGLVTVWRARREPASQLLWAALVLVVGYQLSFIEVILYQYDRFFMPTCLVIALFAGGALARLAVASAVPRAVRVGAIVLVLGFGIVRAATLDLLMVSDSRNEVEAWLAARSEDSHLAIGDPQRGPRIRTVRGTSQLLAPTGAHSLATLEPRFVVVNVTDALQSDFQRATRTVYERLLAGEIGYQLHSRHRYRPPRLLRGLVAAQGASGSLYFVNPELAIFERRTDPWPARIAALAGDDVDPREAAVATVADELDERGCGAEVGASLRMAAWREPASPAAAVRLARFLLEDGQLDEAWREAVAGSRLAPGSAVPQLVMGEVAARRGRRREAFQALSRSAELARQAADAVLPEEIAWRFNDLGAIERSLATLRLSLDLYGATPPETVAREFVSLLRASGRVTEASFREAALEAARP